jgi:hypothetical protein
MIHRHRWQNLAHPDPTCGGMPVWRVCDRCQRVEKLGWDGWRLYLSSPVKPRTGALWG